VPYILVTGKQEAADGTVNVNERGVEAKRNTTIEEFAVELQSKVDNKT
jgi:threonyl-tRNA synthetase